MAIRSPLQPLKGNTSNIIPPAHAPTGTLRPSCPKTTNSLKDSGSGISRDILQTDPQPGKQRQLQQQHQPRPRNNFPKPDPDSYYDIEEQEKENELGDEDISTPPYLLNLTPKDAETLRIPDDEFKLDTWETVKRRVQENKLDEFKRVPSQLRRYLEYVWLLKQSPVYGGVQNFVLRERLGWDLPGQGQGHSSPEEDDSRGMGKGEGDLERRGNGLVVNGKGSSLSGSAQSQPQPSKPSTAKPENEEAEEDPAQSGQDKADEQDNKDLFANPQAFKILQNDWPYGLDERIVHLVVWTKFPLEDDPLTGDLKPTVRKQIDDFVKRTFTSSESLPMSNPHPNPNPNAPAEENVIWFKNWTSIKSIHSVEHFHVMLFDPDPDFVDQVTGGDIPLWKKQKMENNKRMTGPSRS
ncbi:Protein of unknown function (DUF3605) domain containing protein [Naviculisporaceae sp. PSN 640]